MLVRSRWGGKLGKTGKWWCEKVGGSWFYSRVGNTGWVQDFILLFLMLMKGTKGVDWKFSCMPAGMERHSLDLPWAVYRGMWECVEFVIEEWCRVKIVCPVETGLWFYVLKFKKWFWKFKKIRNHFDIPLFLWKFNIKVKNPSPF